MKDDNKHMHWVFDHNDDDVRGWPVHDHNDVLLGTVSEVLVDPQTSYVTELRLSDGTRVAAERVQRGEHVLFVVSSAPIAATPPVPATTKRAAPVVDAPKPLAADDVLVELAIEDLEVGKRRYDAGGVHVETHIVSEPIVQDVHLRDDHVSVERTKVDRVMSPAEADRLFRDAGFEVTARAEVPVVKKQAHIVEELVIRKAGMSRDTTVRSTVRQMEAAVTELRSDAKGGVR
jgi:stress response protein YsnF